MRKPQRHPRARNLAVSEPFFCARMGEACGPATRRVLLRGRLGWVDGFGKIGLTICGEEPPSRAALIVGLTPFAPSSHRFFRQIQRLFFTRRWSIEALFRRVLPRRQP